MPAAKDAVTVSEGGKLKKAGAVNTTGERLRKERDDKRKESQPPRLIVRNLPWSIQTTADLTKLFRSYGKVKHAVVPKKHGKEGYGFGIVIIKGKKNAERALQAVNGKEVDGRVVAVDWMAEKEEWEKVKEIEAQSAATLAVNGSQEKDKETDADAAEAVDDKEHIDDGASDSDAPDDGDDDDLSNPLGEDIADIEAAEDKPPIEDSTIFIRNLPYTTDDETLREHFTTHFGPTRYARVVFDHDTERPRGTGFVCFVHSDDARLCVKEAPKKPDTDPASTFLTSRHQSVLQNDALDPSGKYTLDTRLLSISRAVPKGTADHLSTQNALSREKAREKDKRRLFLLSEGTIPRQSTLYAMLSKAELDIREASAKQRQRLIKTNPNLGLSLTRLSIRNLPRWVDSKELKQLARTAVVGFAQDCKEGKRSALTPEENRRAADEMRELETQRKKKGVGIVKQAKVVFEGREGGKVKDGMGGRSRGYGFIEYWGHRSALSGLRWLNGYVLKPKEGVAGEGERGKRLIVEFAIENAQVVQRRGEREVRGRERAGEWQGFNDPDDGGNRERGRTGSRGGGAGGKYERPASGKRESGAAAKKRKRSESAAGAANEGKGLVAAPKPAKKDHVDGERKNKIAMRNRIISKKRVARKARK